MCSNVILLFKSFALKVVVSYFNAKCWIKIYTCVTCADEGLEFCADTYSFVSLFVSNEPCSSDEGQERLSHIQSENMTFSTTILTQRGKNLYV